VFGAVLSAATGPEEERMNDRGIRPDPPAAGEGAGGEPPGGM
jgi:hypothetical protein